MPVGVYAPDSSTGNGVTTVFPYTFRVLNQAHLKVTVDGVIQTLGADYTVSGVGNASGGNVTFGVAPANGTAVIRYRDVPYTRVQDYQTNGDLKEETLDADFDNTEMQIQQIAEAITRALHYPLGTSGVASTLTPVADGFVKFNAANTGLESVPASLFSPGSLVVSAFTQTLLDDATAAHVVSTLFGAGFVGTVTADTNNYNLFGATSAQLSSTAAWNITGIVAGVGSGHLLAVHNASAFELTLKDESASSTAANRFALNGDYVLAPDASVLLYYSGLSARWRVLGQQTSGVEDTAPDTTNDRIATWDVSAKAWKWIGPYRLRSSAAQVLAGTDDTTFLTPARLTAALGFSGWFQSAQQVITSAGALTLAHALTRKPILVAAFLVCETAEHGYSIGDELAVDFNNELNSTTNSGLSVVCDATNVSVRYGSAANAFYVLNKGFGNAVALTNANWKLLVRAWG